MMDAGPNMVLGVALGAAGWWLLGFRRRPATWVGAVCFVAAVCLVVIGAITVLGRPVASNVIAAVAAAILASGVFGELE